MSFDFAPSGQDPATVLGLSERQRERLEQFKVAERNLVDARGLPIFPRHDAWIVGQIIKAMFDRDGNAVAWPVVVDEPDEPSTAIAVPTTVNKPFGGGTLTETITSNNGHRRTVITIGGAEYAFNSMGYDADPDAYMVRLAKARKFFGLADAITEGFAEEMARE